MTPEDLQNIVVVAQINNNDGEELPTDSFRFKNSDISKGTLQILQHSDLIEARDDAWSTTTWEWTESGSYAREMCGTTPVSEATDEQLSALREHAGRLQQLPVHEKFEASEYNLRGQNLQTLSQSGLLQKIDTSGPVVVWALSKYAIRLITSIEANELDISSSNARRDSSKDSGNERAVAVSPLATETGAD